MRQPRRAIRLQELLELPPGLGLGQPFALSSAGLKNEQKLSQ
jgi:hypothetical protein